MGLWQEYANYKQCTNAVETSSVSNQVQCQLNCVDDKSCVGISYGQILYVNMRSPTIHCFKCFDDVLKGGSFGFYKKPGNKIFYCEGGKILESYD